MKSRLLVFIGALLICGELSAQTDYPGFRCYIEPSGGGVRVQSLATTPVTGTTNMAIVLCVEKGQETGLLRQDFVEKLKNLIPDYFMKATFNNYHVNVLDILVKDQTADSADAFELAGSLVPYPDPENPWMNPDFVVGPSLVRDVLNQADAIYNFGNYDGDKDGIVDYLAFWVVRFADGNQNGTTGLSINDYYYTNDYQNGNQIRIDGTGYMSTAGKRAIILRKRNADPENLISIAVHELGHSLFSFPDVEHSGGTYFNHSSFGDFDPMSSGWGGFGNVASLYNPGFRVAKGWVTPVDASGTKILTDFDATGQIHSYSLPSYSNAYSNQKLYFTFYTKDQTNHWQANWDVPTLSDHITHAGVLAWRTIDGGSWSDRKAMPITLEAAHGKWLWNDNWPYPPPSDKHPTNTGQADILDGLDSLQLRYSYIWQSFTGYDQDGKATYANHLYRGGLYQVGSASCFFDPEHNRNFAFYTNPSSNEISSTDQSRSITPGFAMKNLRWEGGQLKADFVTGEAAYTITENATLTAGTWYMNNTVTVATGATLTINPGAVLDFAPSTQLAVFGRIIANGATFTSSSGQFWTSIALVNAVGSSFSNCNFSYSYHFGAIDDNASNVSIDNCTFSNFRGGAMCFSGSNPNINSCTIEGQSSSENGVFFQANSNGTPSAGTIRNSVIENCGQGNGIVITGGSSPTIESNTIRNNFYHGIIIMTNGTGRPDIESNTLISNGIKNGVPTYTGMDFHTSGGLVHLNSITGSNFGIYCESYSSPSSASSQPFGQRGGNIITSNLYGMDVYNYSNPIFGTFGPWGPDGACNQIYGNTNYDIYATVNSTVTAEWNWWGQAPPNQNKFYTATGSTIDYSNWLSSNNCPSRATKLAQSPASVASDPSLDSTITLFRQAVAARAIGNQRIAASLYRKVLRVAISDVDRQKALVGLFNTFQESGDTSVAGDLLAYCPMPSLSDKPSGELSKSAEELLAQFYIATRQTSKAQAAASNIAAKYRGTELAQRALILLASLRAYDPRASEVSSAALNELKTKFGASTDAGLIAALTRSDDVSNDAIPSRNIKATMDIEIDSANGSTIELEVGNYPNPFNPSTTISFRLPTSCHVTLKIYDVLGREVATLVNEHMDAGTHSVQFNGQDFSSGLFFYRITAGKYSAVRKMLLVK